MGAVMRRFGGLFALGSRMVRGYSRDNCAQMAAAISYHVLFAIVPLAIFAVSLIGLIAGSQEAQQRVTDALSSQFNLSTADVSLQLTDEGQERLASQYGADSLASVEAALNSINSDPALKQQRTSAADLLEDGEDVTIAGYTLTPDDVEVNYDNLVLEAVHNAVQASGTASVLSLLFLAYGAAGLFGVVRRSLDFVWDTPRHLPFVTGKLVDLAFLGSSVVLGMLTILALLTLSIAGTVLVSVFGSLSADSRIMQLLVTAASLAIPIGFSFGLFVVLYRYGPHTRNSFRNVWLGALLAAIAFEVLKFGFAFYVTHFDVFSVIYGALGGVLLFMLFTYLSANVFLYGAEFCVEFHREVAQDAGAPLPFGSERTLREQVYAAVRGLFVHRKV